MCNGNPRRTKEYGWTEKVFQEDITKNFPNFMVDTNPGGQETQGKKTKQKSTWSHFIFKLLKIREKTFKGKQRDKHITCRWTKAEWQQNMKNPKYKKPESSQVNVLYVSVYVLYDTLVYFSVLWELYLNITGLLCNPMHFTLSIKKHYFEKGSRGFRLPKEFIV